MKKILLIFVVSMFLTGCFPGLGGGGGAKSEPGEYVKGRAVSGFPDVPLHPKAKIIESYGDGSSYGASAYVKEEIGKVVQFYEEGLPLLGWESQVFQKDGYVTFELKNESQQGQLIINKAADGETVAVTIAVSPR